MLGVLSTQRAMVEGIMYEGVQGEGWRQRAKGIEQLPLEKELTQRGLEWEGEPGGSSSIEANRVPW